MHDIAILGAYKSPSHPVDGQDSYDLDVECILVALGDAGLGLDVVDGLASTTDDQIECGRGRSAARD